MPKDCITMNIEELIASLQEMQQKGCNQVIVEGTISVVDGECHSIIASTEPQW